MKEYRCCLKFRRGDNSTYTFTLNSMSRLGGVALTSPSLHTKRISEEKLNYLPFQILDSNHIPSCTSAGKLGNVVILMYTDETVLV
jgi:hypothetical protein